ncbi:MAG: DedA family protein [bacterium]
MLNTIISFLAQIIINVISATGHFGVFLLMLLESCGVPAPSEIIMAFAGYLVYLGKFNIYIITTVGALANLAGSLIAYWIGFKGGRPLIEKYGRYLLISKKDLDWSDKWFAKNGSWTVFIGRLLPAIRTYISFPAGIAKMNLAKFSIFTLIGAWPWCFLFTWFGFKLGEHWLEIKEQFHNFDVAIYSLIIIAIILYVWRHLRQR